MKFKKVLLVNPMCATREDLRRQTRYTVQIPMSLLGLGTYLRDNGVKVRILDLELERDMRSLDGAIRSFGPDLIGVAVVGANLQTAKAACESARLAGKPFVIGGPYPTNLPARALSDFEPLAVLMGEAEESLLALCKGVPFRRIRGICYRARNGRAVVTSRVKPGSMRLDDKPLPDLALLGGDLRRYREGPEKYRLIAFVSRGCPYGCSFCQAALLMGKRWRAKNPAEVMDYVRKAEGFGYTEIEFMDDIFGLRKDWLTDFCGRMVSSGAAKRVRWCCRQRVDTVDASSLAMMKRAGCRMIYFGVESGSQRTLDRMRKGVTVAQIRTAFRLAREAGIRTVAYVIMGYPGETMEDIAETRKLLDETEPDFLHVYRFAPLPGTVAYDEAVSLGICGASAFPAQNTILDSTGYGNGVLSDEELRRAKKGLYRSRLLRPRVLLRALFRRAPLDSSLKKLGFLGYLADN